ncbi:MAG: hypothetical protein ACLTK0_11605 [Anaerovoracaceae bacterium]
MKTAIRWIFPAMTKSGTGKSGQGLGSRTMEQRINKSDGDM